jgi:hypothetical protein
MAKVTIDKLAEMMNRSFTHLEKKIDNLTIEMDTRFEKVDTRLEKIEYRLDTIEGKLLTNYENRISRLEDDMRVVKNSQGK